jgi:hypothetical protein
VPWLTGLRTLLKRGMWVKLAKTTTGGDIDALVYSRVWPDVTGDALLLRSEADASAVRLDAEGYQVQPDHQSRSAGRPPPTSTA